MPAPFRLPDADELGARLDAVLEAIYAAFSAGWAAGGWIPGLVGEGIWLGRLVAALLPEAGGARAACVDVARPGTAAARRDARAIMSASGAGSHAVAGRADRRGRGELLHASTLRRIGRFQLEAAIQSAHAARRRTGRTAWREIVALYDGLLMHTGSPVVALNRAVAIGERMGGAGLAALDRVGGRGCGIPTILGGACGLLAAVGDADAADAAYARATGLEPDQAVRRFLQRRRAMAAANGERRST